MEIKKRNIVEVVMVIMTLNTTIEIKFLGLESSRFHLKVIL